jgi:hypothetical protein
VTTIIEFDGDSSLKASTPALLAQYASILVELRRRGVVRTRNAPLGDYAEYVAKLVYGGTLAPNSEKSYDVIADDGRLIQVKARTIGGGVKLSAKFSAFRSFDFDVTVFLALDMSSYDVVWAREVGVDEVRAAVRFSTHINGNFVSIREARRLGTDVTDLVRDALGRAG